LRYCGTVARCAACDRVVRSRRALLRLVRAAALVVGASLVVAIVVLSIMWIESQPRLVHWFIDTEVEQCDPLRVAAAIERVEPYNADTARLLADAYLARCSEDDRILRHCDPLGVAAAIESMEPHNSDAARFLADSYLERCSGDERVLRAAYHLAFERGDFQRAADIASRLVAARPSVAEHHFLRARARRELNDREGAALDFRAGLALAPDSMHVRGELARLLDANQLQ
jgi:hypothetical protein